MPPVYGFQFRCRVGRDEGARSPWAQPFPLCERPAFWPVVWPFAGGTALAVPGESASRRTACWPSDEALAVQSVPDLSDFLVRFIRY